MFNADQKEQFSEKKTKKANDGAYLMKTGLIVIDIGSYSV